MPSRSGKNRPLQWIDHEAYHPIMSSQALSEAAQGSRMDETDEIEFTSAPELTPEQTVIVDLHSVINLISVLYGCLELIELEIGAPVGRAKERVFELSEAIKEAARTGREIPLDPSFPGSLSAETDSALKNAITSSGSENLKDLRETIASVLEIFVVRIEELQARIHDPQAWAKFSSTQLSESIERVLAAIEQNAHGRYRIVKNIAEQTPHDYQVDLDVSSDTGEEFLMPPVLQDVLRDLIANARKYTAPGGKISAGLHSSVEGVRLVIEDNGAGIPKDELRNVAEFGYRASNVSSKRTLGGGFGLTKALWVAKRFNGRMWIRSRLGVGTRITLFIPRSPEPKSGDEVTRS